jgi:predicted ArsR family transcriptional regulator
MQTVLALLKDGKPRTAPQMFAELGVSQSFVTSSIRRLKADKQIRISGYVRNNIGHPVKLWAIGSGKDARKPKALTSNERKALARNREQLAAKALEKEQSKRPEPFRHWQDVLLFGAYAKSFKPQIPVGRVYRQAMDIEETEAA